VISHVRTPPPDRPPNTSLHQTRISSHNHSHILVSLNKLTHHPAIAKYKPQDATTNPSLILAAAKKPEYAALIDVAVAYGKEHGNTADEKTDAALDRLLVEFGKEILKIVPGKVSTEVDARFSFDTKGTVDKALHILDVSIFSIRFLQTLPHFIRCRIAFPQHWGLGTIVLTSTLQPSSFTSPLVSTSPAS